MLPEHQEKQDMTSKKNNIDTILAQKEKENLHLYYEKTNQKDQILGAKTKVLLSSHFSHTHTQMY